jgi:hypothetical protein
LLATSALHATTASPVSISSIAVAGSIVTVTTSAAHNLSASLPSGFCISGSSSNTDNGCGVVLTAPTGTTFTFTLSGAATCAASCGTVLPAKRVIWLNTYQVSGGYSVNYVLWIATTSGVAGKASVWSGASSSENAALNSGQWIEVSRPAQFFPLGTTLASAETQLALDWVSQQSLQTGSVQPGQFYGDFYDGTGWVQ